MCLKLLVGMKILSRAVSNLILLLMSSCVPVLMEPDQEQEICCPQDVVTVHFDIGQAYFQKSSISPEEDLVENLNLYAYSNGILVASRYFQSLSSLALKLLYGQTYNLYALANTGLVEAPLDEAEFRRECLMEIENLSDLDAALPMSWELGNYVVDSLAKRVKVRLERLVSKVLFSVDKSALDGLQINSVRLRQSARYVWPYRYEAGSRIVDDSCVSDGDYANPEDLETLNSGGEICFYVLENCQGELLEGNEDPWAKVPENIPGKEGLCTYLETDCTFEAGGLYSGSVMYRLYLGKDSVADFNIMRNSVLDVSLFLTGPGLGEVSWRVDADVSINDGYARGWISRGLHSITDLYMGERFIYTLELTQEMMAYFGGNYEKIRLCSCNEDGCEDNSIEFGTPHFTGMSGELYVFEVDGLCCASGAGDVCLIDDHGNHLTSLGDYLVKTPRLYVSDMATVSPGNRVSGIGVPLLLDVNGEGGTAYLYMVDNKQYNLNSSAGVGYEFSLFDFSYWYDLVDEVVGESLFLQVSEGMETNDGPCLICSMISRNDGSSDELSGSLLEFWSGGDIGKVVFDDDKAGVRQNIEFGLDYMPITLTLVDNGWAGYSDCQISMIVDNPSNFPIKGQCWQLNMLKDRYNAISRNEIVDLYGKEFTRQTYEYVCGDFPAGQMPLYCSGDSFNAKGSCICHFPEISTPIISNAALYDYMTQDKLYHHIDAVFENGEPIYDLKAIDNLSDGSMQYNIIYGNDPDMDGWDDRGIWLYSGGICISKPATDFDLLSGVNPISLSALAAGETGGIKISYDAGKGGFTACANSAQSVGLQLNAEVTVSAYGYVSTTPNGTMFGSEDNYCSSNVSKKVSNVILGLTPVEIDGGAVKSALNAIYSHTFYDSYNLIGSSNNYAHHAHPTSIDVSMKFSLSGDSAGKMVVLSLTAPSSVSFYHSQESVTYSVAMKTTKQTNKVGIVQNLKK